MTVKAMYQVGENSKYKEIGEALARLSHNHVVNFDGQTKLSFSYGNCNAAVAVDRVGGIAKSYRDFPENLSMGGVIGSSFVAIYGCSRLYVGLDPQANSAFGIESSSCNPFSSSRSEQHAEQTAILIAKSLDVPFWTSTDGACHLYVDFTPCKDCYPWLDQRTEDWIVHYAVELEKKATFASDRRKRHRRAAQTWQEEAKERRRADMLKQRKARRLDQFNKNRPGLNS